MGLQSTIQTKIAAAFNGKLADAVTSVTFTDPTPTYDPATGVVSETTTSYSTRGVLSRYTEREVANSAGLISNKDWHILVLTNEITVTPQTGWAMTVDGETEEFQVQDVKIDPAGVTFTIRVRS